MNNKSLLFVLLAFLLTTACTIEQSSPTPASSDIGQTALNNSSTSDSETVLPTPTLAIVKEPSLVTETNSTAATAIIPSPSPLLSPPATTISSPEPTNMAANPPETASLPTATAVFWQPDPDTLVFRLWRPGRPPGVYARWNIIPQMQIWGDGRIMWLTSDSPYYQRQVSEGYLSANDMALLYQHIIDSDFANWAEQYDQSAEPLPRVYLAVDLASPAYQPRVTSIEGETPEQFQSLLAFLNTLPDKAQSPQPFVPTIGEVHVHGPGWEANEDAVAPQWPTDAQPLSEDAEFNLTGENLLYVWELINNYPAAPLTMQQGNIRYMISLSIPDVTFCRVQTASVMDFC